MFLPINISITSKLLYVLWAKEVQDTSSIYPAEYYTTDNIG